MICRSRRLRCSSAFPGIALPFAGVLPHSAVSAEHAKFLTGWGDVSRGCAKFFGALLALVKESRVSLRAMPGGRLRALLRPCRLLVQTMPTTGSPVFDVLGLGCTAVDDL